jgi:predicted CopG family antitoxin
MGTRKESLCKRCTVLLREDVYEHLSRMGQFHESFSDLVARLLDELDEIRGKSIQ